MPPHLPRASDLPEIDMRSAWDRVALVYQQRQAIATDSAHYGPWAPLENELRLLGDVAGLRILEIGCGGGQCSIAFAKQGAIVTGLDLSDVQLQFARDLAAQEQATVRFVQGAADNLSRFGSGEWDVVFGVYAFHYVAQMPAALSECCRVLRPGGLLLFSLDHPFRDCFLDDQDDEMTIYASRSYFERGAMRWRFSDTGVTMVSYHHTVAQWSDMLHSAGFVLRRLLEPAPPLALLDELWPVDGALASLRNIPQTIIFMAEKTGACSGE